MHGTFGAPPGAPTPSSASFAHTSTQPPLFALSFDQRASGSSGYVLMALIAPALAAAVVPYWLVASLLYSDASARAVLLAHPVGAGLMASGLLALVALFGWPMARLAKSALGKRRIAIADGHVVSTPVGRFGKGAWREPLGAYQGVAHRVSSSLSGVQHDLLLVHPRADRCLVLCSHPRISPDDVRAAAHLLSVAEIPSRDAASLQSSRGLAGSPEPRPHAVAA